MRTRNSLRLLAMLGAIVWLATPERLAASVNCYCSTTIDGHHYILLDICGEGYFNDSSGQGDESSCASWCLDTASGHGPTACGYPCDEFGDYPDWYSYYGFWYFTNTNTSGYTGEYYGDC